MWTASPFPTAPFLLHHHRPPPPPPKRNRAVPTMSLPQPPTNQDPLTALSRLLWGPSLPPSLLISAVRSTWSATWRLMMRQLAPSSPSGSYSRPASPHPTVPDSYLSPDRRRRLVLYVAHPCPWAHRAVIVRALTDSEESVPISLAVPGETEPWVFAGGRDPVTGKRSLREVYGGGERATVPMLWDRERGAVVCNESYGIIDFFNRSKGGGGEVVELVPEGLEEEIAKWNRIIYPNVNNGVYRCGFAQSQEAYDVAVNDLFSTLDMLESHLSTSRYLCRDVLTLADVCLFTTLIRFDLVYNVLFKCTKKKLLEYPNLYGYTQDIYQIPKVAETCNFEAIMDGYYRTLFPLNPGSIRPVMPSDCEHEHLFRPHNRESLSLSGKHPQLHVT